MRCSPVHVGTTEVGGGVEGGQWWVGGVGGVV